MGFGIAPQDNYILNKSPGIGYISTIEWPLVLSLLASWVLVFICLIRGTKSFSKVVYFTVIFPYVILLILGIRGWMLPGASKGILFYIRPVFSKLLDARVWNDAANQIFFVLSVSYGGLITLSSYNRFNQNTLSNTLIITITNVITSIFAGFVIFAFLGYLAYITGQEVTSVVTEGPGLAFVIYSFAVTTLPGAPLWSILFFLMLIALGTSTVLVSVDTITTVFTDQFNSLRPYKTFLTLIACVIMFLLGLVLCTDAGIYWLELLDRFIGSWTALTIALLECICIAYVYGGNNFRSNIQSMFGSNHFAVKTYRIFQFCWLFATPALLAVRILYYNLYKSFCPF
ncbi:unnamed protein product [Didymodactylos carnosus]|uniref:Uncharacterized protein n=1 Tax=Didymodactylos carnosus TaxID=1234261 RepID=A0A815LQ54_9BILA|nr:unnamed protein product [Didymodactylos carnosus]CAF4299069.1 unnamed protein product [Didymodactylos carnosus]